MIAVPDASAAFEYLSGTFTGSMAAEVLDTAVLAAPVVLDVEVLSVIRRHTLNGRIKPPRAKRLLSLLEEWDVQRLPVRQLSMAAFWMRDNFTASDAYYVLVAQRLGATLVTADARLARAPGLGVAVHHLPVG